ncbi:ABC transporter related protein [Haliangium ochraceum DSM 14365]|uniref:ABC transporter related protein n=2 Tax=Haliangium ochraceum TaxID=80816 RepID=D0LFX5_HALO1|nr:ABC transporter related protein [Haliangium ochraceum DSM 14365]
MMTQMAKPQTQRSDPSPAQGAEGAAVSLRGVAHEFGDVRVFEGIDLEVPAGQFAALLGPSGCGKSTLLRLVAALERPSAGVLEVAGRRLDGRRSQAADAAISFVFQDAHLLPWRTLVRNVELPLELAGVDARARRERAMGMLEQVGLADAATRYPAQLSGGMRMRGSLARALVTEPGLLLLDEPFAALDEITRQRLDIQLYELSRARKLTVLLVTHSIAEAVFLAERTIMLSRRPARIVADRAVDIPGARDAGLRSSPAFVEAVQALHGDLERAEGGP